jgi:hypothetical protein
MWSLSSEMLSVTRYSSTLKLFMMEKNWHLHSETNHNSEQNEVTEQWKY